MNNVIQGFLSSASEFDIIAHFVVGMFMFWTLQLFRVPKIVAFILIVVVAFLKEGLDPQGANYMLESTKDIGITMLGCWAAAIYPIMEET